MTGAPSLGLLVLLAVAGVARAEEAPPPPREAKAILEDLKSDDLDTRLAAVEESRSCHDASLTSPLVRMLKDRDPDVRIGVVGALGARQEKACRKKAAAALASRLALLAGKLAYEDEYVATIRALHDLAEPGAIKPLMDFGVDEPEETAKARLFAVANTPCADAIESLITFLSKGRKRNRNQQRQACVEALRYATGQKLGNDPDQWRQWWREVKDEFDFQVAADERAARKASEEEKEVRREEQQRKKEERRRKREEGEKEPGQDG